MSFKCLSCATLAGQKYQMWSKSYVTRPSCINFFTLPEAGPWKVALCNVFHSFFFFHLLSKIDKILISNLYYVFRNMISTLSVFSCSRYKIERSNQVPIEKKWENDQLFIDRLRESQKKPFRIAKCLNENTGQCKWYSSSQEMQQCYFLSSFRVSFGSGDLRSNLSRGFISIPGMLSSQILAKLHPQNRARRGLLGTNCETENFCPPQNLTRLQNSYKDYPTYNTCEYVHHGVWVWSGFLPIELINVLSMDEHAQRP